MDDDEDDFGDLGNERRAQTTAELPDDLWLVGERAEGNVIVETDSLCDPDTHRAIPIFTTAQTAEVWQRFAEPPCSILPVQKHAIVVNLILKAKEDKATHLLIDPPSKYREKLSLDTCLLSLLYHEHIPYIELNTRTCWDTIEWFINLGTEPLPVQLMDYVRARTEYREPRFATGLGLSLRDIQKPVSEFLQSRCERCGEMAWTCESVSPSMVASTWACSYCKRREIVRRDYGSRREDVATRSAIPKDVQREVWRRDQARCVECGSAERLEFDHIIPVALGGGNTARNIQLLCEGCNRRKRHRPPGAY